MNELLENMRYSGSPIIPTSDKEQNHGQRSWVKVYLLIGITSLLAVTSGFLLRVGEFGYGMIAFVFWATILTIQSLILKGNQEVFLASSIGALGLMLPFWGVSLPYWGATAFIIFFLLALIHERGKREEENMVKIRFSHATRPVVGLILTIGVIMTTFLFSFNGATVLTESNIKRMVDLTVTPIVKNAYYKDFSSDDKLGDVFKNIALAQIEKDVNGAGLSDYQKQFLASQSAQEMETMLEEKINFDLQADATVASNIHSLIVKKSNNLLDPQSPWGIVIVAAVILLIVKSIEIFLYIPLGLLSYMLYELLIAFGFIVIQSESRGKEVINLL